MSVEVTRETKQSLQCRDKEAKAGTRMDQGEGSSCLVIKEMLRKRL